MIAFFARVAIVTPATLKPDRTSVVPDLLGFCGTAVSAWFFHWDVNNLLFSLWFASLSVGYLLILWMLFANNILGPGPSLKGFAVLLGGTIFFTIHFGGFHAVHAFFLIEAMPDSTVMGRGLETGEIWKVAGPMVLGAFLTNWDAFRRAKLEMRLQVPYVSVVKIHLTIFAAMGFTAAGGTAGLPFMLFLLLFFFFPWSRAYEAARSRMAA